MECKNVWDATWNINNCSWMWNHWNELIILSFLFIGMVVLIFKIKEVQKK